MEENKDLMMEITTIEVEELEVLPMVTEDVENDSTKNTLLAGGIVAVIGLGAYMGYKAIKRNKSKDNEENKEKTSGLKDKFRAKFGKKKGMDTDGDVDFDEEIEFESMDEEE